MHYMRCGTEGKMRLQPRLRLIGVFHPDLSYGARMSDLELVCWPHFNNTGSRWCLFHAASNLDRHYS
jgi:hypothetical protein